MIFRQVYQPMQSSATAHKTSQMMMMTTTTMSTNQNDHIWMLVNEEFA
jgi:hypothetical protein